MWWDAHVQEWDVLGVSTRIVDEPAAAAGYETTNVHVNFNVVRKVAYYIWKIIVPLYLAAGLTLVGVFEYETDDYANRSATIATYFLAVFAFLFVVAELVPK